MWVEASGITKIMMLPLVSDDGDSQVSLGAHQPASPWTTDSRATKRAKMRRKTFLSTKETKTSEVTRTLLTLSPFASCQRVHTLRDRLPTELPDPLRQSVPTRPSKNHQQQQVQARLRRCQSSCPLTLCTVLLVISDLRLFA